MPHQYSSDADGRLWVIGQAHDSTWVDLFDGTQFVKRWTLSCAGTALRVRNAKTETHLALVCEVDDPAGEGTAKIKVYQIVRSGA